MVVDAIFQRAQHELPGLLDARIQIEGAHQSLVDVFQRRMHAPGALGLLRGAKGDARAYPQILCHGRKGFSGHQGGLEP